MEGTQRSNSYKKPRRQRHRSTPAGNNNTTEKHHCASGFEARGVSQPKSNATHKKSRPKYEKTRPKCETSLPKFEKPLTKCEKSLPKCEKSHQPQRNTRTSDKCHSSTDQRGFSRRMQCQQPEYDMIRQPLHWQRYDVLALAKESSSVIIEKAQNEEEAFFNALKFDKFLEDKHVLAALIRILYGMVSSSEKSIEVVSVLISRVMTDCELFVAKLRNFIQGILLENVRPLRHIIKIAAFCVKHIPSSSMKVFPHADLKDTGCQLLLLIDDPILKREFDEYSEEHEIKRAELVKSQQQLQQQQKRHFTPVKPIDIEQSQSDKIPPENYRDCNILPEPHEINDHLFEPFLRPNLISSDYLDPEHYLDVQFRLLKEDFVGPLRDGIHSLSEPKPDLTLYHNVCILLPVCLFSGIGFQIQFDTAASRVEGIRWEHSRKLIYGSLLCLSNDGFRSLSFATVVSRDAVELKEGRLIVKFEGPQSQAMAFTVDPSDQFVMVESSAYFEAYRHVLEGLQEIVSDQMPFRPYIVGGHCFTQAAMPPPAFLRQNSLFDLNDTLSFSGLRLINVIKPHDWPQASKTNLDESQLAALKMALSQEISLIQGPPGTGKTYIGLKIVQAILQNRSAWDPKSKSPILVVCYTNHALDQFLEGILKIPMGNDHPKIVRVGGRCKSEELKPYVLANMVKCMREEWRVPKRLAGKYKKCRVKMEEYEEFFENSIGTIELSEGKLPSLQELDDLIDPLHYNQLTNNTANYDEAIEVWLGLVADSMHQETDEEEALLQEFEGLIIEDETCSDSEHENNEEQMVIDDGDIHEEELIEVVDEPLLMEEDRKEEVEEEFEMEQQKRKKQKKSKPLLTLQEFQELITENKAYGNNSEQNNEEQIVIDDNEEVLIEVVDEPLLMEEDRKEEIEEEFEMEQRKRKKRKKSKAVPKTSPSEGEWQVVERSGNRKKRIKNGLREVPYTEKHVSGILDIWQLSMKQKWKLYLYWLNAHISRLKEDLNRAGEEYNNASQRCLEISQEINLAAIFNVHVIGMTTTGAAKHNYILKNLHPKILIVEEAAEVMEAHIVTSLCSSVQQLILIGDHKQLQPKPAYYPLEKQYNFNISLFERLITKGVPCVTLTTQHRMRPEIARIVGNHIYDELHDSDSVKAYEHIKGVEKSLFFIEHKEKENGAVDDGRSHSNTFEARYITSLTSYFLKQGYKPNQITILTMYRGQLIEIKQKMKKSVFGGVRVAAVDDFQGEENDIIILSLVRSNSRNIIGFLKVENRVCVALSRAKKGMFVIGNFSMLRGKENTKWPAILEEMEAKGYLGDALSLCCYNHPQTKILARTPEDFSKSPAGGCQLKCSYRLKCGHMCPSMCHPNDPEHENFYKCTKKCTQVLECGHICTQRCYQCRVSCGPCSVKVAKQLPQCGHIATIVCSSDPLKHKCTESCTKLIDGCGHKCSRKCYEECVPARKCPAPCQAILDCSHKCKGRCGTCYRGRLHVQCKQKCNSVLVCGHTCDFPCPQFCPPCLKPCDNYCYHSKCPKKCYEPCAPCREPCKWECRHYKCTTTCGEMCNRPRCDEFCIKVLKCGHPCIGLCGEDCPTLCRICDKKKVTEVFFGFEDEKDARFIQLKDCGHILEVTGLDQWMDQNDSQGVVRVKECPKCKTAIRRSLRYGNTVKRVINDIEAIKQRNMKSPGDIVVPDKYFSIEPDEAALDHVFNNFFDFVNGSLHSFESYQFDTVQNQLNITPQLLQLLRCIRSLSNNVLTFGTIKLHRAVLLAEAYQIMYFMKVPFLTSQQLKEVAAEFSRVFCLARLSQFKNMIIMERKTSALLTEEYRLNAFVSDISEMGLQDGSSANNNTLVNNVDKWLEYWKKTYRVGELSKSERLEIMKAMTDIKKGSWYKCRNGHFYCIGECGGAVAESKCPECHTAIGGRDHQLRKGNVETSLSSQIGRKDIQLGKVDGITTSQMDHLRKNSLGITASSTASSISGRDHLLRNDGITPLPISGRDGHLLKKDSVTASSVSGRVSGRDHLLKKDSVTGSSMQSSHLLGKDSVTASSISGRDHLLKKDRVTTSSISGRDSAGTALPIISGRDDHLLRKDDVKGSSISSGWDYLSRKDIVTTSSISGRDHLLRKDSVTASSISGNNHSSKKENTKASPSSCVLC